MKVTVFGTGNMGRALATRLLAGGNDVQVLGTEPEKTSELVEELQGKAAGGASVEGGASAEVVSGGVVVLAVWYDDATSIIEQRGEELTGKVVVDITNPVDTATFDGLVTPPDGSAAEEIAKKAPGGAKVVKAFNTTFAGTLVDGEVAGHPLDVFIASDDDDAKARVVELVKSAGLRPIDAGALKRARELEGLGFLHMTIQDNLGTGYCSAVKIVS